MSVTLIDWEQLDMIADGFTPDFVEIYVEYLAEIPVLIKELQSKIAANDTVNASKVAHQIKGSSANFGFIGVSHPVAQIEANAKAGSLANAATLASEAALNFDAAVVEVKSKRGA